MRGLIIVAALLAAAAPARAAVTLEMSEVTCQQYMDLEPDTASFVANWMRGYYSATKNLSTVDFKYVKRNTEKVAKYCKSHKKETLMNAIQKNAR